jgi:hypothetical protein
MWIIEKESTRGYNYNYNQAIVALYYQLGVRLPQHGQGTNRLVNLVLFSPYGNSCKHNGFVEQ